MLALVLTAMVLSVEWILAISAWFSHVPVVVDLDFVHSIVPCYQRTFHPQRDLFLYALWMAIGTCIYGCLWWLNRNPQIKKNWDIKPFLIFHGVLLLVMAHALFEVVTMDNPIWAWPLFWGSFVTGAGATIFWPEFVRGISFLRRHYASLKLSPWVAPVAGCLFIFLVVFTPDVQAVVAMVYMGEYFHNWDVQLYGAVYAISKGLVPGVDVMTTYGFGVAVMAAKIVNWMGGFDYVKLTGVLLWVGIIYYCLWYLLLRRFLASSLLAFAAIVCAMRMQMFNLPNEPFIWAEWMASALRYCFDAGVFWMLWMHIQTRKTIYLAAGAFFVSLAVFHILTTGISMVLVFGLYVTAAAFMPNLGGGKDRLIWRNHALVLLSLVVWTGLWFYLTVGTHLFTKVFWQNVVEYNSYFVRGVFSSPLTMPFIRNNYAIGIGGLLYPVFYLGTFLYATGLVIDSKARGRDVFAGLIAFYGLIVHAYYIVIAAQWYSVGLPGIYVFFYWVTKGLEKSPVNWQRPVAWALMAASLYCMVTDRLFIGYPNLLNVSRNPIVDPHVAFRVGPNHIPYFHQIATAFPEGYKLEVNSLGEKDEQLKFEQDFANQDELKAYYVKETAWPEDTALIRRLVPEGGKAAVLSSFEVMLLKNADRKPFFYYFPVVNSMPLTGRNFMVTGLFSYPQVQKVLDQLEIEKPTYIFMERLFLASQVPQAYFYDFPDLIALLQYVRSKYVPVEVGKFLVAMKRR
jgi:hypothetical protein